MRNDKPNQTAKDVKVWVSGADTETPSQRTYFLTLAEQTGEDPPDNLSKD